MFSKNKQNKFTTPNHAAKAEADKAAPAAPSSPSASEFNKPASKPEPSVSASSSASANNASANNAKPSASTTTTAKPAPSAAAAKPAESPVTLSNITPKQKSDPSVISSDVKITGDVDTTGDLRVEGHVVGNVRAHTLTIGETALIEGEIIADDANLLGKLKGTLRGINVRLFQSAHVDGDIYHKTLSIESGAHFEGKVSRQDDPLKAPKTNSTKG